MTRLSIALLLATACSSSEASKPAPQPTPERNLVCERVKLLNAKAECVPEFSGASDLVTHTARVTIEKVTLVCGLNAGQLAMRCDGLEWQPPKQEAKADEGKPAAKGARK